MRTLYLAFLLVLLLLAACQPGASPTPDEVEITVYFTDSERYAAAIEPFEVAVTRTVPAGANLPAAVLDAFFAGPTAAEAAAGLDAIISGATGYSNLRIEDGIAHVTLAGDCNSGGATYTIAQPLMKNLLQFDAIAYVKIYDANGETEVPDGPGNSIPFCLEP
jgi:hypothetical protein